MWGVTGRVGGGKESRSGLASTYSPPSVRGIRQGGAGKEADSFNSLKGAQIRSREGLGAEGIEMGGRS